MSQEKSSIEKLLDMANKVDDYMMAMNGLAKERDECALVARRALHRLEAAEKRVSKQAWYIQQDMLEIREELDRLSKRFLEKKFAKKN